MLDPGCGSGHMLTYAFDLLYAIYAEAGYAPSEIPGLILPHNLYGLDICPRAAQLAALALVLKAREKSRPFFQPNKFVQPKIMALQDVRFEGEEVGRNKPAPAGVSGNLTGRMPETVAARPYSGLHPSRHSGMDCRNPDSMDGAGSGHPCHEIPALRPAH